jgi:hypothetical protein
LASVAQAQTTIRSATDTTRDAASDTAAAAKAAVTPGAQNMGRNRDNRIGGLMGTDHPTGAAVTPGDQDMGRDPNNRSGGMMGNDCTTAHATTTHRRAARAERN